jgi:hypothetical protein
LGGGLGGLGGGGRGGGGGLGGGGKAYVILPPLSHTIESIAWSLPVQAGAEPPVHTRLCAGQGDSWSRGWPGTVGYLHRVRQSMLLNHSSLVGAMHQSPCNTRGCSRMHMNRHTAGTNLSHLPSAMPNFKR